jgi:hypothetical protein
MAEWCIRCKVESSAAAHLNGENNILVNVEPMSAMVGDWKQFLSSTSDMETNLFT